MRRCVPLLTVCTVWLCCAMLCDPVPAVPHCSCCATVFRAVGYTLCSSLAVSSVLCPMSTMLCWSYVSCRRWMAGNGGEWQVPSQNGGGLPIVTNAGDQTKNHVVLHVEHPTNPYRILCSRCETNWCVWLGQGSAYQGLPIN